MKTESLELTNYRNIRHAYIEPCDEINIIYGENAQGKTNLIEGLWLLSGFKSFRSIYERDVISFGADFAKVNGRFYSSGRTQTAEIVISDKKKVFLNGVELDGTGEFIGNFRCVVFSPSYLSLIKGVPGERRKFTDIALCQIKPSYSSVIKKYNKILSERNSFLKDLKFHSDLYDYIDVWNRQLAETGAVILKQRREYVKLLDIYASEIYHGLSGNKESFNVEYNIKGPDGIIKADFDIDGEEIIFFLKKCENKDIITGTTNFGVHRDDLDIKINGNSVKNFGSQGQQRSAALAMKLAEAEILYKKYGEKPVTLLDDVMSELDVNRQDYILNRIKDRQVFITCCEPSSVLRMCKGKTFNMHGGIIEGV